MKKAQFEVIGLLIIVILISLGVIFVMQFVVLKSPSNIKSSHVESQFAASFLIAFTETTAEDCYNQQMKSLIHDCVSNDYPSYRVQCNNGGDPIDSCAYLNKTAYSILNQTLINNRRSFKFTIRWDLVDKEYLNINNSLDRCSKSTRIEKKNVPLQVDEKEIDLYLELCN